MNGADQPGSQAPAAMMAVRYRCPSFTRTRAGLTARGTLPIMVEWETGLVWLVAALLAAFAVPPADTQHARFAPPANRLMDGAAAAPLPVRSVAFDFYDTGPPAALSCLSA